MRTSRSFGTLLLLILVFSLAACGGNAGTGSTVTSTPTMSTKQLATGAQGLPLYCPLAVTVDRQDNLYVSDNDANMVHERIIKLSPAGQVLNEWHLFPPGNMGMTQGPGSLAIDAQGNLYVIDLGKYQVVKVSPAGKILTRWGTYGSGSGQFQDPEAVAVDSQGTVYVGDINHQMPRIEKFSGSGTFLGTVMVQVKPDFIGLAVDSSDNLYVANDISIMKLSPTGRVLASSHLSQTSKNTATVWTGLATNARGHFFAATVTIPRFESGSYPRLLKLNLATGSNLAAWDVWKAGIVRITSIALDNQGDLYAAEQMKAGGRQLQKFSSTGTVLATWRGTCTSS